MAFQSASVPPSLSPSSSSYTEDRSIYTPPPSPSPTNEGTTPNQSSHRGLQNLAISMHANTNVNVTMDMDVGMGVDNPSLSTDLARNRMSGREWSHLNQREQVALHGDAIMQRCVHEARAILGSGSGSGDRKEDDDGDDDSEDEHEKAILRQISQEIEQIDNVLDQASPCNDKSVDAAVTTIVANGRLQKLGDLNSEVSRAVSEKGEEAGSEEGSESTSDDDGGGGGDDDDVDNESDNEDESDGREGDDNYGDYDGDEGDEDELGKDADFTSLSLSQQQRIKLVLRESNHANRELKQATSNGVPYDLAFDTVFPDARLRRMEDLVKRALHELEYPTRSTGEGLETDADDDDNSEDDDDEDREDENVYNPDNPPEIGFFYPSPEYAPIDDSFDHPIYANAHACINHHKTLPNRPSHPRFALQHTFLGPAAHWYENELTDAQRAALRNTDLASGWFKALVERFGPEHQHHVSALFALEKLKPLTLSHIARGASVSTFAHMILSIAHDAGFTTAYAQITLLWSCLDHSLQKDVHLPDTTLGKTVEQFIAVLVGAEHGWKLAAKQDWQRETAFNCPSQIQPTT